MRHIFLVFSLFLFSPLAIANMIQFPLLNQQMSDWNCQCQDQNKCTVEKVKEHFVITLPANCSISASHTDAKSAAVQWEVLSLEKPESPAIIAMLASKGKFKSIKTGITTILKENIYHTVTGYLNLTEEKNINLVINNSTSQTLHIIDSIIHTSNTPRSGALLGATGGSLHATYVVDEAIGNTAWVPLPLDYENQVPLDIHFNIEPKSLIKDIKYEVDDLGNWGATIQFQPNIPNGRKIDFTWEALVLTNDTLNKDGYKAPSASNEWLASSLIVQSTHPAILKTAQTLLDPNSKMNTVINIITWLKSNITFGVDQSFDALHVFESKIGPCTGYSNLAASFGRALGIPSITLAGYSVGTTAEMHWINQFYLGNDIGWFRFEPQFLIEVEPEYLIPVRIDRITDEVKWELTFGIPRHAYPAIPLNFDLPGSNFVEAYNLREFVDPQEKMNLTFNKARVAWQKDFKTLLATNSIPAKRQKIREQMKNAKSLDDLNVLLDKLGK